MDLRYKFRKSDELQGLRSMWTAGEVDPRPKTEFMEQRIPLVLLSCRCPLLDAFLGSLFYQTTYVWDGALSRMISSGCITPLLRRFTPMDPIKGITSGVLIVRIPPC